jgi:hypothetical protein
MSELWVAKSTKVSRRSAFARQMVAKVFGEQS